MRYASLALLLLVAACGGGAPATVVGPPQVAWKDLTKKQRFAYMKARVMPQMKTEFVAFKPKRFADFDCTTCHGKGAEDGTFKMPNPDLPTLPTTKEGFEKLAAEKGDWLAFMNGKVKTQMAGLLGKEPFEPEHPNPEAFGCPACHPMEGH